MSLAVGREQPTSNQAVSTRLVRHCPNHLQMVTVVLLVSMDCVDYQLRPNKPLLTPVLICCRRGAACP